MSPVAIGVGGFNRGKHPMATVPGTPTIGVATSGDTTATANWTAPASNGGSAITGYEVKTYLASDNSLLETNTVGLVLTFTDTGRTNGVGVYFKVAAINAVGTGAQSAASNTVTPVGAGGGDSLTGSGGVGTLITDLTNLSGSPTFMAVAGDNHGGTVDFSTVTATDSQSGDSYIGPMTAAWVVDQTNMPWWENYFGGLGGYTNAGSGTHGGDSSGSAATLGDTWEVTVNVNGGAGAGFVIAGDVVGTYSRVGATFTLIVNGDVTIFVSGNQRTVTLVDATWTGTIGSVYDTSGDPYCPEYADIDSMSLG